LPAEAELANVYLLVVFSDEWCPTGNTPGSSTCFHRSTRINQGVAELGMLYLDPIASGVELIIICEFLQCPHGRKNDAFFGCSFEEFFFGFCLEEFNRRLFQPQAFFLGYGGKVILKCFPKNYLTIANHYKLRVLRLNGTSRAFLISFL